MGKSPVKWIKGILFGRKASKSSLSTGRELSRSASEKPTRVSSKEPISTSIVDTPLISDPISGSVSDRIDNSSFEKGEAAILASEGHVSSPPKKDVDKPSDAGFPNDPDNITLEQAATVMQAFFRGYKVRREFRTLKGVIWLQSAVCGRLVRRQAVATLFCMQGIVRLQAIMRGYMVRQARIGNGQCRKQSLVLKDASYQDSCDIKYSPANTLLKNAFIYKEIQILHGAGFLGGQYHKFGRLTPYRRKLVIRSSNQLKRRKLSQSAMEGECLLQLCGVTLIMPMLRQRN